MDRDRDELMDHAKRYLKREGIEEVHSISFVKESASAFGKDLIFQAEIEDEEESDCWVIGGSTPMNLYAGSQFSHPEEAYQFHFGTVSQLLHREMQEENPDYPEWVGYDAFICHASEDKEGFVRPLAKELSEKQFRIWYDEFELSIGDSLRESIDRGLSKSAYGIVVLSESFFDKEWTRYELNGLVARETTGETVILPVWYTIGKEEVAEHSPTLADKVAVQGTGENVSEVADQLYQTILEDAREQIAKEHAEVSTDQKQ